MTRRHPQMGMHLVSKSVGSTLGRIFGSSDCALLCVTIEGDGEAQQVGVITGRDRQMSSLDSRSIDVRGQ